MSLQLPYETIKTLADFELRSYPGYVLAEVQVRGDFITSGNSAFQPLLRYITGLNDQKRQLQMTAPVLQTEAEPDHHLVSFVLPPGTTKVTAPIPTDAQVQIIDVEPHLALARKFSGGWSFDRFLDEAEKLEDSALGAIAAGEISGSIVGDPYFARYNSPFSLPFLRHNEVLVGFDSN